MLFYINPDIRSQIIMTIAISKYIMTKKIMRKTNELLYLRFAFWA